MRSRTTIALLVLLVFAACGRDAPPEVEEPVAESSPTASQPSPEPANDGAEVKEDEKEKSGPEERGEDAAPRDETDADDSESTAPSGEDASEGPDGDARATTEEPGSRAAGGGRGGSALAPAPGTYVYDQDGYEEFCTASCNRRALPRRQTVSIAVTRPAAGRATVVTKARSSNGGMTRASTEYTRSAAAVTEVYVRFSYSGYTFDETYRPQPPVETLRFPLTPGAEWSGSWRGEVSGRYRVSVEGRESVTVDGKRIEAIKVAASTTFNGDFSGRANTTSWIDPRDKAVLRTAGNLDLRSAYGRYASVFATRLVEGPGY